MTPDVVVDIGNTRIKWGWGVPMRTVSLPPDDSVAWDAQLSDLPESGPLHWVVASVHPTRLAAFMGWATDRGDRVSVVGHEHVPIMLDVDEPGRVGIDRLVTASAAARRSPGQALVVASVGTAVTVDFVRPDGVFAGGSIFPGLRLMTRALHEHTAALPQVEVTEVIRSLPAKNTIDAIRAGVFWSVVGGISFLSMYGQHSFGIEWPSQKLYLTGGDSHLFAGFFNFDPEIVPTLTLEGIRIAAEALP